MYSTQYMLQQIEDLGLLVRVAFVGDRYVACGERERKRERDREQTQTERGQRGAKFKIMGDEKQGYRHTWTRSNLLEKLEDPFLDLS